MITTIPLPERGITCLPPWPQAMAFADKRLENRGYGVARQIGEWRGLIAVSQSKTWDDIDCMAALDSIGQWHHGAKIDGQWREFRPWAGKIAIVAEIMDILPPGRCAGHPWHVPGQHGLSLGRVWLVDPVPCTGGVRCWGVEWCPFCAHVYAVSARKPHKCYSCKKELRPLDGNRDARPMLKVIKECVI